jgi:NitT/TauT family transport system ATP-binding protein
MNAAFQSGHLRRLTTPAPDTHISVRSLSKTFGDAPLYVDFDIDFPRGKIVTIFGPNGCGKSTLINLIAGLIPYDDGRVMIGGKPLSGSKIGYVFQNYREALFPWIRAIDNIHYPLKLLGMGAGERKRRIESTLADFDLKFDLNRYPYELSGGQQQTVSIIRALVVEPEVMFLDEPFSALDYEMTLQMRDQLQRVFMKTQTTTILVSHDLEEAVYLSDFVLLLTRRPTTVADYVPFNAPRPRSLATLSDPEFIRVKAHCLDVFQREVRKGPSPIS